MLPFARLTLAALGVFSFFRMGNSSVVYAMLCLCWWLDIRLEFRVTGDRLEASLRSLDLDEEFPRLIRIFPPAVKFARYGPLCSERLVSFEDCRTTMSLT